jgi:hypothetical protein
MDENELQAVNKLLQLAKLAIIAMLVIGGYMGRETLIGIM